MLILIQTRRVLTRPWCVVEVLTALDADVPIVCVVPAGVTTDIAYDFSEAIALLSDFEESVDAINPGAMANIQVSWRRSTGPDAPQWAAPPPPPKVD